MSNRIATIIIASLLSGAAYAGQTTAPKPEPGAGKAGSTSAEIPSKPSQPAPNFRSLDSDRDGAITKLEAKRYPVLADGFEEADTDGNGRVTMEEYIEVLKRLTRS